MKDMLAALATIFAVIMWAIVLAELVYYVR